MYGFIGIPVCRSIRGRAKTKGERRRTPWNPLGFVGLPCHHGVAKQPDVGCPGFPRSPPSDTKGPEQSGPFVFAEAVPPLSHGALLQGCTNPWHRPATGMGARRWHEGGFRPFFEMCTSRCASVHGLGKTAFRRHFKAGRSDSPGGINSLALRMPGSPVPSVAVVPKDSDRNVAVVPKDSFDWRPQVQGLASASVAVMPNNPALPSPHQPRSCQNRRRIGRESARQPICRMSPFCQSQALYEA